MHGVNGLLCAASTINVHPLTNKSQLEDRASMYIHLFYVRPSHYALLLDVHNATSAVFAAKLHPL